ncbi:MAG: NADH-quinone oxidoreductase subunit C, partial [Mesorhizobium sp.]|nr:NADH-quinone oxidoreductase subunit C [Mesorhizobium sp.]
MSEALSALSDHIKGKLGDVVIEAGMAFGELTVRVAPGDIVKAATFLRDDAKCRFVSIIDVCGADYPDRVERF